MGEIVTEDFWLAFYRMHFLFIAPSKRKMCGGQQSYSDAHAWDFFPQTEDVLSGFRYASCVFNFSFSLPFFIPFQGGQGAAWRTWKFLLAR